MYLQMTLYFLYGAVVFALGTAAVVVFYAGLIHLLIIWPLRAWRRRTGRTQPPAPLGWAPPAA